MRLSRYLVAVCVVFLLAGTAPAAASTDEAPGTIAFWDRDRGLAGYPDLPGCAKSLRRTTNGGQTFVPVGGFGAPVAWVETVGDQEAYAVIGRCGTSAERANRLFHSTDGGQTWQFVHRTPAHRPSFPTSEHGLGFLTRDRQINEGYRTNFRAKSLMETTDGGVSWHRVRGPCDRGWLGISISFPTPSLVVAVCVGDGAVGTAAKRIYYSRDGGREWTLTVDVGVLERPDRGIATFGEPLGLAFSPGGNGLFWDSSPSLYRTASPRKNWEYSKIGRRTWDYPVTASLVSREVGYLLIGGYYATRLVRTSNEGRSGVMVRKWPSGYY